MTYHLPTRSFVNKKKPVVPERPKVPSNVGGGEIKVGDRISVGKGYARVGDISVGGGEARVGDRLYAGKGEARVGDISVKRGEPEARIQPFPDTELRKGLEAGREAIKAKGVEMRQKMGVRRSEILARRKKLMAKFPRTRFIT